MLEPTKAKQLLEEVKKYELRFCSICSAPSASTFTALQKSVTYYPYLAKSSVLSFFDVSTETLTKCTNEVIGAAVSRLKAVLNDSDLLGSLVEGIQTSESEKEQFVYVSSILLLRLTGMFTLNSKEYSARLFSELKVQPLTREPMGMGETTTWHGDPDGYCDLLPVKDITAKEDDQDSDASSGGKATFEAKVASLGITELNQVTGHAVVMSFIHTNRHPAQNVLIPALGISGRSGEFVAALYDCHRDVLLHLHPIQWLHDGKFMESAILLLWLFLHHKIFLCRLSDVTECYKSGLLEIFNNAGTLSSYQKLKRHNMISWLKKQWPQDSREIANESEPWMKSDSL